MHPELTADDVAYVTATFRILTDEDCEAAERALAPQPSYLLPDGRAMGPANPDPGLARASEPDDLRQLFVTRWEAAGGRPEEAVPGLGAWLGGGYGVCLACPSPESILAKAGLAQAITALLAQPRVDQDWWRQTLRCAVSAYDQLVLPFASVDAARFGSPTSRTRLVDMVRERWPEIFVEQMGGQPVTSARVGGARGRAAS